MRIRNLIIIFSLCIGNSFSQNLVPNPSFENGGVPFKFNDIKSVEGWGTFPDFSEDYFNKSANDYPKRFKMNNMGVPKNDCGYQQARTGNAYAGLAYSQEILQCELISTLIKDTTYYLEFYTSLADSSDYAIWRMGAFFSNQPIDAYKKVQFIHPQLLNDSLNYLTDTVNWIKISGFYKAKGGEKYLSIGTFAREDYDRKFFIPDKKSGRRYYYIDDVSMIPINSKDFNSINKDTVLYLRELFFNSGQYALSENSYAELDAISSMLKNNNKKSIEISG